MPTISKISAQRRNQERANIFLDGAYAFSLTLVTAAGLRVGQVLDEQDLATLRVEDDYERAKEAAISFITYRPRSEREVRQRLHEKEYDDETIARVIQRLSELQLLDDEAFARYWLDQRETFRPRSQMALRQELAQKGVSREVVDEVLGGLDEEDAAVRAAENKASQWAHLPQEEFAKKMGGFLQRRGFGYAIIHKTITALWQEHGRDALRDE
jgi:regulatory protein